MSSTKTTSRANFLKTKFLDACIDLNARILEPYLHEKDVIYGKGKWEFLAYMRDLFYELDEREIIKLIPVKRYCLKCHPNQEIIEFYSKESTPEYYRYLPKGKILKPVFAFVFPKTKDDTFEVDQCFESRGFQPGGTVREKEDLKKLLYGNFG